MEWVTVSHLVLTAGPFLQDRSALSFPRLLRGAGIPWHCANQKAAAFRSLFSVLRKGRRPEALEKGLILL